jgi:alpha-tubulin suppressor-like RCC1 family protein
MDGALLSKTVVALAAGGYHSLALTADGLVFAWGRNYDYGQLGNGSATDSNVPVAVTADGELAGKTVVAVAAGGYHSLALTADGLVFAWGRGDFGQLGNGSDLNSFVPVAVDTNGVLAGKTVVAIAAGTGHSLALTSDGLVFAWGYNYAKQLGNDSTTNSNVPVAVMANGVLAGKAVVAIAAPSFGVRSLALTADGKVFAWGANSNGQLGDGTTTGAGVPVATQRIASRAVTALASGRDHSVALAALIPTVESVAATNGTYTGGQDLDLTVTFDGPVTVSGTPRLALTIGSTTRYATYVSGTNLENSLSTIRSKRSFAKIFFMQTKKSLLQRSVSLRFLS